MSNEKKIVIFTSAKISVSSKPKCKYGKTCYRTSEKHLSKYDHPDERYLHCNNCKSVTKHYLQANNCYELPAWFCSKCR